MMDPFEIEEHRDYIGDGVYVAFDGYAVWLRIDDHRNVGSQICLEPEVLEALVRFARRKGALDGQRGI